LWSRAALVQTSRRPNKNSQQWLAFISKLVAICCPAFWCFTCLQLQAAAEAQNECRVEFGLQEEWESRKVMRSSLEGAEADDGRLNMTPWWFGRLSLWDKTKLPEAYTDLCVCKTCALYTGCCTSLYSCYSCILTHATWETDEKRKEEGGPLEPSVSVFWNLIPQTGLWML